MLCYGAKFKYTPGESAVFVKIGPDLVAGWDGQKVADGWIGQPVCSFSDDGNLLAAVTLVHERPAPVAVVPEGWQMVPVAPTDDMIVAFAEAWYSKHQTIDDPSMLEAYHDMLVVAPTYPRQQ